jgi:hypothetical protein
MLQNFFTIIGTVDDELLVNIPLGHQIARGGKGAPGTNV